MAHDIYVEMYHIYGAYIFDYISESEQRHMDSAAKLIFKNGLDDPVLYNESGVFANKILQDEYVRLLDKGHSSIISALEVGVEIEEMDIGDILRMLEETDKADIKRVLSSLLDGSRNHLDAFDVQLELIP